MNRKTLVLAAVLLLLLLTSFSVFVVDEGQKAIKFRFGEIVSSDYAPGLHFKVPFVNNVRRFNARLLNLDIDRERFLTNEKKNLIVSLYVRWRISDVRRFWVATGGLESRAGSRISNIIKNNLRSEFGKREIKQVVSGDRREMMGEMIPVANAQVKDLGVVIEDVRVTRIDLPQQVSDSVFSRMRAERKRVADQLRSEGAQQAEVIEAEANRERIVILADAERDANRTRGEGDAQATKIYAQSYGRDKEFYAFYRSLNAYRSTFNKPQDMLILKPDSDFFRYFGSGNGNVDGR